MDASGRATFGDRSIATRLLDRHAAADPNTIALALLMSTKSAFLTFKRAMAVIGPLC